MFVFFVSPKCLFYRDGCHLKDKSFSGFEVSDETFSLKGGTVGFYGCIKSAVNAVCRRDV